MEPTTGFARLGDQRIYYLTLGEGPPDLIVNTGSWGSVDVEWEDPGIRLFFRNCAQQGRVILFDRRGTGASDPIHLSELPPWESFVEEVECVMDAVGSESATVLGGGDGGPTSLLFAANRPDRVNALVLYCTYARLLVDDDYPFGYTPAAWEDWIEKVGDTWGTPEGALPWLPSKASDPAFLTWMAKVQRSVSSPSAAVAYARQGIEHDVRAILPAVRVPTLVAHPSDCPAMPVELGRYIADHVDGAEFVEVKGTDASPYWENPDELLSILFGFVSGKMPEPVPGRRLSTVMFTDIVDSTRRAEQMGDRSWKALLDEHDATSRRLVARGNGEVIKTTGDGVLATFDGPGRAILCAGELNDELSRIGITLRTGLHIGEIEIRGEDVGGVAVNLASRVMSEASPGEILVSATVKDLVVGSGIVFTDRGLHHLKGIEGEWHLYSVSR